MPMTDEIADTVWSWLNDPAHVLNCLIAEDVSGKAIGLAHIRAMPRPLSGTESGFLDDLFVDPDARGQGVFEALFKAMDSMAQERGWTMVRWLTQEFNYRGRSAYDGSHQDAFYSLSTRNTPIKGSWLKKQERVMPYTMIIALAIHIVSAVIWVGGMFFAIRSYDPLWAFWSTHPTGCAFGAGSSPVSSAMC